MAVFNYRPKKIRYTKPHQATMRLLFELVGPQTEMAKEEAYGILDMLELEHAVISQDEFVLVLEVPGFEESHLNIFGQRAGLIRTLGELIFHSRSARAEDILAEAGKQDLRAYATMGLNAGGARFGVKPKRMGGLHMELDAKELAGDLGFAVKERMGLQVDLAKPDIWFDVIISSGIYFARRLIDVDRRMMEYRKGNYRPFFSPISLHPKYARACINIARSKDNFLDPFCGTGGFLLEGAAMGLKVFGSDLAPDMIAGSRKNLEGFDAKNFALELLDVGDSGRWRTHSDFPEGGFDAIITDPPYGRASTTMGEEVKRLYSRAFENLGPLLRPDGKLLMILPDKNDSLLAYDKFLLERIFDLYVHKSLTRYYCLFKTH